MLPRWVRHVVFAALALSVWLATTPAFAAAPQCDVRGAITFAPTPTLQPPSSSIDTLESSDDCLVDKLDERAVQQGRSPTPVPQTITYEATLPSKLVVLEAASSRSMRRDAVAHAGAPGVASGVDRPPR